MWAYNHCFLILILWTVSEVAYGTTWREQAMEKLKKGDFAGLEQSEIDDAEIPNASFAIGWEASDNPKQVDVVMVDGCEGELNSVEILKQISNAFTTSYVVVIVLLHTTPSLITAFEGDELKNITRILLGIYTKFQHRRLHLVAHSCGSTVLRTRALALGFAEGFYLIESLTSVDVSPTSIWIELYRRAVSKFELTTVSFHNSPLWGEPQQLSEIVKDVSSEAVLLSIVEMFYSEIRQKQVKVASVFPPNNMRRVRCSLNFPAHAQTNSVPNLAEGLKTKAALTSQSHTSLVSAGRKEDCVDGLRNTAFSYHPSNHNELWEKLKCDTLLRDQVLGQLDGGSMKYRLRSAFKIVTDGSSAVGDFERDDVNSFGLLKHILNGSAFESSPKRPDRLHYRTTDIQPGMYHSQLGVSLPVFPRQFWQPAPNFQGVTTTQKSPGRKTVKTKKLELDSTAPKKILEPDIIRVYEYDGSAFDRNSLRVGNILQLHNEVNALCSFLNPAILEVQKKPPKGTDCKFKESVFLYVNGYKDFDATWTMGEAPPEKTMGKVYTGLNFVELQKRTDGLRDHLVSTAKNLEKDTSNFLHIFKSSFIESISNEKHICRSWSRQISQEPTFVEQIAMKQWFMFDALPVQDDSINRRLFPSIISPTNLKSSVVLNNRHNNVDHSRKKSSLVQPFNSVEPNFGFLQKAGLQQTTNSALQATLRRLKDKRIAVSDYLAGMAKQYIYLADGIYDETRKCPYRSAFDKAISELDVQWLRTKEN